MERSARRSNTAAEADVADRPHRPPTRRVLAVDVRVKRHVDVLVENVDRGRAAGARCPELPAVRVYKRGQGRARSKGKTLERDDDDAYLVRNGAFGAWTFVKGPVTLCETAYEMS